MGLTSGQVGLYGNAQYNKIGDGKLEGHHIDLADSFTYGVGLELGARSWIKGIVEMSGESFVSKPSGFPEQDEILAKV